MQSLPGAHLPDPVALTPSAVVKFDLADEEKGALLDVVVPDATVKVTLTMPDGRTLRQGQRAAGVEWTAVDDRTKVDPPGSWFGIGGFLLPVDGTHHMIGFETAPKGHYEVRAVREGKAGGELRVAFIPLSRSLEMATKEIENLGQPQPGEVRIRPFALPYSCYAGDKIDLQFAIVGDAGAAPVTFGVKLERTGQLPYSGSGPAQYGPPRVEDGAVKFTRSPDGNYHGAIVAATPGIVRVSLRATGKKTSGTPFSDEVILGQISVAPLVARLTHLSAEAVDKNSDHKLDRLDVTFQLDVIVPGEYDVSARVQDAGSGGIYASGRKTLKAGPQRMTVSLEAKEIRKALKDGPYEIREVRIYRARGNFGDHVDGGIQPVRTAPYKLADWDPGPIFADEAVSLRGIRPAPSGRYRYAEAEWGVTTPGGDCDWNGSLSPQREGAGAYVHGGGKLAAGRSQLSFVFSAAAIAGAGKQDWLFSGMVSCHDLEGVSSPFVKLSLDPGLYEPAAGRLSIVAQEMLRLSQGEMSTALVNVPGKKIGQVKFSLGNIPPDMEAILDFPGRYPEAAAQHGIMIEVERGAKPGRYFVGVAATSDGETATTEIVVDVVAK